MSTSQDTDKGEAKDYRQNVRRLSLVTFLLSRPGRPVTAAQVRMQVEGYADMTDEAFKRRFSEDRAELAELGIQIEADAGDDGADLYSLRGDAYYLPKVEFAGEEVTALAACLAVLEESFAYSQPLRMALVSLAQGRPELLAEAEAPPLAIVPEAAAPTSLLPRLQAAVADRKTVTFRYYTIATDQELERTVDPYGLQLVAGEWYLIGHCHLRESVRTFRLSRIRSRVVYATRRPHDFVRPADFDLDAYRDRPAWRLAAVRGTARVRIDPALAWWVEAHWGHCGTVTARDDGGIDYATDYADERPLLSWVLGLAGHAELLEPAGLRARLREQLGAVQQAFAAPAPTSAEPPAPEAPRAPRRARRRRGADEDWRVEVDRFTRLNTLATYLLQSCGKDEADLKVSEICAALGVPTAQLKEDVRLLNLVGYVGGGMVLYAEFAGSMLHVECDVEGPTLSRPARLSPLQADTLLLAIELVRGQIPTVPGALRSAEQKIRAARAAPTVVAHDLVRPDDDVLDAVNVAVAEHRLLRLTYWKEGTDQVTERTVEPYFIRHERGEWYYVCWCRLAQGVRVFRVATTKKAELLGETFEPRDDVELDLYRREGVPTSRVYAPKTATVWYSPLVTRWVEERQPVRRLADGSCLAEQPYVDEGWLTHFLLPFADQSRLLAPPGAVEQLRDTVRGLLALYGE
jgi:predicted DNA-binding transcriptional regulator YafY